MGAAGSSTTRAKPSASAESNAFDKLQGLLSLSTSQIPEGKGLDSVEECLNDLAGDGQLNNETVTCLCSILEQTREYFNIFERALRAEEDFKVALVAQEALCPEVEAIKVKNETLANLDRQIVDLNRKITELQHLRSAVASVLVKDFELNKPL